MSQQIKVRTKMMASFMLLVFFTALVGFMGTRGIKQINHQNEISALVNRALVDAQDAQAGSLRYIIYQDDQYMDAATEEFGNVIANARKAGGMMLSEENRKHTADLEKEMSAYNALNMEFRELQAKIRESNGKRVVAAEGVLDNVKKILNTSQNLLEKSQRGGRVALKDAEEIFWLQEIRNATNRFRIGSYRYRLAKSRDERLASALEWEREIAEVRGLLVEAQGHYADAAMLGLLARSIEQVDLYASSVEEYASLISRQEEIQGEQKTHAAAVLASARMVRDGVNAYVADVTAQNVALAVGFAVLAAFSGVIIAIVLTKSITSELGGEPYEIVDVTSRIADGDLNIEFPEGRKLSGVYESMQNMAQKLTSIVNNVVTSANEVTSGSEQISSSAQQIASGTNEQASSMEEVSSSIEQLHANIQQNTDNAEQSNKMARKVAEDSLEGSKAVADTVTAMKDIAEKISVIQEIARSTNMLALNAAIEAARAGEAGRGFAVVASEVRKLAESSGTAAKDITEITESSVHRATTAQEMIEQIVPSMRKTAELVEEITMASQEQSKGAEQINIAVTQLDTVVQQNASASEELASMSEELLSQATSMKHIISYFKVKDDARRPQFEAKDFAESPKPAPLREAPRRKERDLEYAVEDEPAPRMRTSPAAEKSLSEGEGAFPNRETALLEAEFEDF